MNVAGKPPLAYGLRTRPQRSDRGLMPEDRPEPQGPEWELVKRITASRGFVRSALLTRFLLYVSERTLSGHAAGINELQIGLHVFDRDAKFKSTDDNIVRNYARMLRKRIADYFEDEGRNEPLRLEIPRGGYVPRFRPVTEEKNDLAIPNEPAEPAIVASSPPVTRVPEVEESASPVTESSWWKRLLLPLMLLTSLLLGAVGAKVIPGYWSLLPHSAGQRDHRFWSSLFSRDHDTFIVASDGGLVILHRFLEKPTDLSDYINGNYRNPAIIESGLRELTQSTSAKELPVLSQKIQTLGDRRYTSVVDMTLTSRLARLPEVNPERLRIRYARDLRMDDLKTSNAILIGSVDANPWVELYQPQMNFQFTAGNSFGGSATIVNRKPLPGEHASYASISGDPTQKTYGVIAYMPNLTGTGHVLLVEGINMAGTEAAGEFLLDPQKMGPVLEHATTQGGELMPFELLLETSNIAANSSRARVLSERIANAAAR